MVLAVADLRCLQIVGSVALVVTHLLGDLQTVGSSGSNHADGLSRRKAQPLVVVFF